jgi:prepilin-type N-terminal cleavage/methylation domain-containing protein
MWNAAREGDHESRVLVQKPPAEPGAAGVYARRARPGVTLIELLVTIMIISILAAAILGVAAVAGETAREAKTKTVIARIHTLLMQQYDTYVNRRVKLQSGVLDAINNLNANAATKGRLKAEARLYALREMMLMEIPDRWSDVLLTTVPGSDTAIVNSGYPVLPPVYLEVPNPVGTVGRTELANVYLRQFDRLTKNNNKITGSQNTAGQIRANQSAECLYMVVMNACGDGEARTLFPESNIGDTDGDGAPEFIDGWGHPIEFLRWAPGFESDIQTNANNLDATPNPDDAWVNAGAADHDPFDLYRRQPKAYRLVPLVYSLGRDEAAGIITDPDPNNPIWRPTSGSVQFPGSGPPYVTPALNPYATYSGYYLGSRDNSKADVDNITNHLISTR